MLEFSELFEFSRENSCFERIRMVRIVRMVRMVRSLADRTFQPSLVQGRTLLVAVAGLLVVDHDFRVILLQEETPRGFETERDRDQERDSLHSEHFKPREAFPSASYSKLGLRPWGLEP